MSRPAVFLDRDGIINLPPPPSQRYITRPEDFHLAPGIAEAIRLLNLLHIPAVAVTNQKCIALGRLSELRLQAIHLKMHRDLAALNARLDAVYHCPHDEHARCDCRKPLPGMLLRAAHDLNLNLPHSWMIGDQPRDCAAGRAAGCRTIYIGPLTNVQADLHLLHTRDLPRKLQSLLKKP